MKITHTKKQPERKLIALIGVGGECIFFPNGDGHISISKFSCHAGKDSLEFLAIDSLRTPVYEGDTVTLEF